MRCYFHMLACLLLAGLSFPAAQLYAQAPPAGALPMPVDSLVIKKEKQVELIYYRQPAKLSVASVDMIGGADITSRPVTSIRSTLTGRLAGLFTQQFSGQPGNDGVGTLMRGLGPITIIDGIPRSLTIFDLEEIESISVLRDAAATAMLGVRGSAGAILITTKKGIANKPEVSFTIQTALQQPLKKLQPLRAYDYATLYNEALKNDGLAPIYTDADLQTYKNGTDPYGHPDINWFDKLLKPSSRFNRYSLNFRGGSQTARYFLSLEHLNQGGIFITSDENKYNTNNDFKSYVIRSNVDVDLNSKLSMGLYLMGRILNQTEPGVGTANVFNALQNTPSNAYPVFNPNKSLAGTLIYQNNVYGQVIRTGYLSNFKRDAFVDYYLKRSLDEITKGLWVRGVLSFNATLSQTSYRTKNIAMYKMNVSPTDTTYQKFGNDGTQTNVTSVDYQGRQSYVAFELGYNRRFGSHGVNALVLANQDNGVSGSDLALSYKGISGRAAYDYKNKYVAELTFGYNGSNRYPEGTRYALFPALGLAWNISDEAFMKPYKWVNGLKLYGSYGKTGWDRAGYFVYNQYYYDGSGAYFGTSATWNTSMNELVLANAKADYEKARKLNVGLDMSLLSNRLSIKAEYYTTRYYDAMMQRGRNTAIIGNNYPDENIGIYRFSGFELSAGWQSNLGSFQYFVRGNVSLAKSEVVYQDEVYRPYSWMKRTGQPVSQLFGYTALGLFQTQAEISSSATIDGYTPQRGDIKYKDMNGDGVINQFDESPVGNTKPIIFYGLEMGFAFHGFDFSALVQGARNRNVVLTGASEWEFQYGGYGQAYQHHLNRWTPANAANADYPRLTAGNNVNNHQFSSFWVHNGNYTRLKFVELGYSLPQRLTGKIKLKTVRLFASATNLLTLSAFDQVDPEVYGGAYPIQRVINTGINIKF